VWSGASSAWTTTTRRTRSASCRVGTRSTRRASTAGSRRGGIIVRRAGVRAYRRTRRHRIHHHHPRRPRRTETSSSSEYSLPLSGSESLARFTNKHRSASLETEAQNSPSHQYNVHTHFPFVRSYPSSPLLFSLFFFLSISLLVTVLVVRTHSRIIHYISFFSLLVSFRLVSHSSVCPKLHVLVTIAKHILSCVLEETIQTQLDVVNNSCILELHVSMDG